ncbi:uncharacterized protein [Spinacia oleracea]|uniref:Arabidopsis retrotransposon Orf1 C-terminal domain-containing protein n=1 Tax=Spinacia oleracea TaxID=3562 RepID=A0ABM3QJN2_SPIOL|nr:uncharacterized protein LOC130459946 [Spinacia oleracea]
MAYRPKRNCTMQARNQHEASTSRAREPKPPLPPPQFEAGRDFPNVIFAMDWQWDRFVHLKKREVIPTRFICQKSLHDMGLEQDVKRVFYGVGMRNMYSMLRLTFRRLTLEFLSSLHLRKDGYRNVSSVHFRLMNIDVHLSLADFGGIFGLSTTPSRKPGSAHNNCEMWGKLTGNSDPDSMQHLHASKIQHPVPIVFYRFLGFTIFGREETQNVRSTELEILGGYVLEGEARYKMNLAHHMASQLYSIATSSHTTRITIGGLITHIAMATVNFVEANQTPVLGSNLLDLAYFAGLCRLQGEHGLYRPGAMYWMFEGNRFFSLPDPQGHTRFRPGQAHYLYVGVEQEQEPKPKPDPQPKPHQFQPEPRTYFRRGRRGDEGRPQGGLTPEEEQGSIHERLGRLEIGFHECASDHQRAMFPIYDQYARQGYIAQDAQHPSWFAYPAGGYGAPGSMGTFTLTHYGGYGAGPSGHGGRGGDDGDDGQGHQ